MRVPTYINLCECGAVVFSARVKRQCGVCYKRSWRLRNPERVRKELDKRYAAQKAARLAAKAAARKVCVICGTGISLKKRSNSTVCSHECRRLLNRKQKADYVETANSRRSTALYIIRRRHELADAYIRSLFKKRMLALVGAHIPPALLEAKRAQVQLLRAIKTHENQ